MKNKELWESVFVTDPAQVRPIIGKQYKGNSPKPYWVIERATEEFGPCGIGWGFAILGERFERMTDSDLLHVAMVEVWYKFAGSTGKIQQMGQTRAVYTGKNGVVVDEDAPKKSVTDALVKCLSMIGFCGDIFSGRWDDNKYVEFAQQETQRRINSKWRDDIGADELDHLAKALVQFHEEGRDIDAISMWYSHELIKNSNESKEYVWMQLKPYSALRSAIKANKPE